MCSTISVPVMPYASNDRCLRHVAKGTIRAEVITAPKRSSWIVFPELSVQGVPHTDLKLREIVERQTRNNSLAKKYAYRNPEFQPQFLDEAYKKCKNICAEYAKTFYLGTTSYPLSVIY
ncbi:hypothetical protein HS088_TW23G00241 [Tripterygium wilfordii]|uniref:Uncharacterized protein n=1 Tax=Tripterygium wilfordii TaxID=458696 RepID=A0A7J7BUK2_TRIWF|nr:hypothetical protein HS088_TW23G00241 [Tripterygium wilfordii]